jgi:hypothetical protein
VLIPAGGCNRLPYRFFVGQAHLLLGCSCGILHLQFLSLLASLNILHSLHLSHSLDQFLRLADLELSARRHLLNRRSHRRGQQVTSHGSGGGVGLVATIASDGPFSTPDSVGHDMLSSSRGGCAFYLDSLDHCLRSRGVGLTQTRGVG